METEKIELRLRRDFGQVFNAAFAFLRQEFKPFCMSLLAFVIPVMFLVAIAFVFFYNSWFSMIANHQIVPNASTFGKFFGLFGLFMLLGLLSHCMLVLTVVSYLTVYLDKKESPSLGEVFNEILKNFFSVIGAIILGSIVIVFGLIFCILPGLYLAVSLSLFLIALIVEKNGIGDAFSRSFQLTHMQWWETFLIILVSFVVYYVLCMILQIPAYIFGVNSLFHNIQQFQGTEMPFGTTYIIYQSIVVIVSQLIYSIPLLILSFHYFNLVELRERPSLIQKIDQLGE